MCRLDGDMLIVLNDAETGHLTTESFHFLPTEMGLCLSCVGLKDLRSAVHS